VVIGRAVAVVVVNPANTLEQLSLEQARALFRSPPADWAALGGAMSGPLRVIERPPSDELLAHADSVLLQGARHPANIETVASDAAARALVANDVHAVTVLAIDDAGPGVRALPIAPATTADGAASPLSLPLLGITRGPARGAVRSVLDWMRAPEQDAMLRAHGARAECER
jgi:phosphate transport system substrate-binding protein